VMDKELMAKIKQKAHYICPACKSENIFVFPIGNVIDCTCTDCKEGWIISVEKILNG
jgi:hypothetical protein